MSAPRTAEVKEGYYCMFQSRNRDAHERAADIVLVADVSSSFQSRNRDAHERAVCRVFAESVHDVCFNPAIGMPMSAPRRPTERRLASFRFQSRNRDAHERAFTLVRWR